MKKQLFILFSVAALLFVSCGDSDNDGQITVAKGGKTYGGEVTFMSEEKVMNLFPASTINYFEQRISGQIFETLLRVDQATLETIPGLAESFESSADGKTYTFKIRKGVYFHDDACFGGKGREMTPEDVKYSLDFACSGLELNKVGYMLVNHINGAKDYFNVSKKGLKEGGVKGITVAGDQVKIELTEPFAGFEKILTYPGLAIFPKEAYEKYGKEIETHPVGTGAFMLDKIEDSGITLKKNPNYWRKDEFGNQLPYLSSIRMKYIKDKEDELLAFRNKEIDMVLEIPVDQIQNILGTLQEAQEGKNVKHKVDATYSMTMHYVGFANQSEEFSNPDVRRAFNMVINRQEIVDNYLDGEGWAATNGFVPALPGYPNANVKGAPYNPELAQSLMAKAGYPNGKGFPALDFYVNAIEGSTIHKMAIGVKDQLKKDLNVDLNIVLCSFNEREEAIKSGKAKIWRSGWIADYPDAGTFLSVLYGGGDSAMSGNVNSMRYDNSEYDKLYERAMHSMDLDKRIAALVACDQIIVNDAVIMPIMTDDLVVMVNMRVRGFKVNAMERFDFSTVFIKELVE